MKESGELDTLKIVNLIFSEHEKLSIENPLLKDKIKSLEELNFLYEKSDSIQKKELLEYNSIVNSNNEQIKKLKSSRKNIIKGSCVGGIVLFILGLII